MARIVLLLSAFLIIFVSPLFAYLDPGTGSYIIQLFIAAVAGIALGLKVFWNNIKAFFRGIFGKGKKKK